MKRLSILTALLFTCIGLQAQMTFNGDLLFGNEWVKHDRPYAKVTVSEDGVYRVGYASLVASGFPAAFKGSEIQAFSFGEEVSLYVSTNGDFGNGDYLEFFGYKNDGALDAPLYQDASAQQLNPKASMFSNTRDYFFTWETGTNNNKRYELASNNLGGNLPNAESFYFHNEEYIYTDQHIRPVINEENVRYSNFFTTEGFGSTLQKTNTVNFPVDNLNNGAQQSNLKVRFGTNAGNHIVRTTFNGEFLESNTYNSYHVVDLEYQIPTGELESNNVFEIEGNASNFDRNTIAHISLEYPRNYNANNQDYFRYQIASHSFKKYFEISNFNTSSGAPVVMDITNGVRVETVLENGLVKFVLDPADLDRDIVVFTSNNNYEAIEKINFFNYTSVNPSYVILTSKELNTTDGSGTNWIQEYAEFRRSEKGGSYDVQIVHSEDLIDQFGFGVENHTIGVRNWSNFLFQRWLGWEHVFIIGKSHEYGIMKTNPASVNYVPTHGEPGSDVLMFATGDNSYPEVGIGRLAANDKAQLKLYYDKMQVYVDQGVWNQSIEDKAWMKKIIHLSGGDAILQDAIRNWLSDMADVIEESTFGADVKTFEKTSNDPIETSISRAIIDEVNDGCSILTFFGHSAVGTFDFSIEDPSQFDNEGKTPLIVSLGCHSGNIHTSTPGISENFVLEPEKGAIAFLAASGTAYVGPQYIHGRDFYDMLGDSLYSQPMGTILTNVMRENTNNFDFQVLTLQQQLTLHGDPALIVNSHAGPDYTPDISTFRTEPEIVSGSLDSVAITLGNWSPENFNGKYGGQMTLHQAFARSTNMIAIALSEEIGLEAVIKTAEQFGIHQLKPFPSLSLGAQPMTPLALTESYLPFANWGKKEKAYGILSITTPNGRPLYHHNAPPGEQILSHKELSDMNFMMRETVKNGTARRAAITGHDIGGKTGTTNDFRDAWFIGYRPDIVTGIWVGADDNSAMTKVTGGTIPAMIFRDYMTKQLKDYPKTPLPVSRAPQWVTQNDSLTSLLDQIQRQLPENQAKN